MIGESPGARPRPAPTMSTDAASAGTDWVRERAALAARAARAPASPDPARARDARERDVRVGGRARLGRRSVLAGARRGARRAAPVSAGAPRGRARSPSARADRRGGRGRGDAVPPFVLERAADDARCARAADHRRRRRMRRRRARRDTCSSACPAPREARSPFTVEYTLDAQLTQQVFDVLADGARRPRQRDRDGAAPAAACSRTRRPIPSASRRRASYPARLAREGDHRGHRARPRTRGRAACRAASTAARIGSPRRGSIRRGAAARSRSSARSPPRTTSASRSSRCIRSGVAAADRGARALRLALGSGARARHRRRRIRARAATASAGSAAVSRAAGSRRCTRRSSRPSLVTRRARVAALDRARVGRGRPRAGAAAAGAGRRVLSPGAHRRSCARCWSRRRAAELARRAFRKRNGRPLLGDVTRWRARRAAFRARTRTAATSGSSGSRPPRIRASRSPPWWCRRRASGAPRPRSPRACSRACSVSAGAAMRRAPIASPSPRRAPRRWPGVIPLP